ncbi:PepSY-like domain-containing protein [Arcicella sp. LKC2W]|uniref:PepSY-like domain-containing protein n=1 Tax=Arcicella sp. LKC2W TaxID=2984198 RepID=UPI002B1EE78D|nr:PepSY-like domain-containing protein [Arcicella sp. LKC2W]MEA5458340.1 PepSY-like domain-containing protein [Arcicella sp. LKC2W]
MKKILFLLTAISGLFLASCNQQDINADNSDDVFSAIEASAARTAAVNDTVTKGKCKGKLTSVDITTLPATITTYINANYAGSTIKFAGKDEKGQYVVGVSLNSVETGLLFDANGAFVQTLTHYGKKARLTEVAVADLPASVGTYVTANYAGYTIKKAGKDADGNLIVGLSDGTNHKALKFDSAGVFKEELQIPPHGKRGKKK